MADYAPAEIERANRIITANTTPRYRRLENLENWVAGTQYQGRKSWWDDSVPLWERAPCLVYPVAKIAIASNVDLVLGEGRFPVITSKPGEDESEDEGGLSEDVSADLDRFIVEHHKLCVFRARARESFGAAQGCGSSVQVHGVRNGKPFVDALPAKWCTPDIDGERTVGKLEIRYPFVEEYKDRDGVWKMRIKLFRRVIDDASDTTYVPEEAFPDGREPSWSVLSKTNHNFGFCPVIWYPFMRTGAPVNQIDGEAIHTLILDEIEGHDVAISQRHRCALFSEPQIVEAGVSPGFNPTDVGRTPAIPATLAGGLAGPGNPQVGSYEYGPPSMAARKKGPGYPWQYPNPETKVTAITIGADALQAQADNASDIRLKLQEALCVVFLDPENIKFAATTSGKALEAIKQKQIDRCDQYRDDLRDNFILPSVHMQLRIAQKVMSQGQRIDVPGAKKIRKLLDGFVTNAGTNQPTNGQARRAEATVESAQS